MQKLHLSELIFFWVLFAGAGFFAGRVLYPYLVPMFLGSVLAIIMRPAYRKLHVRLPGKPGLVAGVTTLLTVLVILLPLTFAGLMLTNEVSNSVHSWRDNSQAFGSALEKVQGVIQRVSPATTIEINPSEYIGKISDVVASNLLSFFSGAASVVLNSFLMLVTLFFLLRDGHKLHAFALAWSPLPDKYDRTIIARVGSAVTAVVKGTLLTALVQGVLAGIGFAFFGAPSPTLWGAVAVLAAMIPLVGTTIITIPLSIVVFMTNGPVFGIGLLLWSVLVVGGVDNFIRPMFIRGGLNIHPLLILLSVMGGLSAFGPIGFIAGPIVLALFFALLDLYPEIVKGNIEVSSAKSDIAE